MQADALRLKPSPSASSTDLEKAQHAKTLATRFPLHAAAVDGDGEKTDSMKTEQKGCTCATRSNNSMSLDGKGKRLLSEGSIFSSRRLNELNNNR
jgi:hypothetical protein